LNFELCEILQLTAKWVCLDGPHCIFGQLIFGTIIKIIATRGQILRLKCTKFYLGWSLQHTPDSLAGFEGPTSKVKEGRVRKAREEGRGGERKKTERRKCRV